MKGKKSTEGKNGTVGRGEGKERKIGIGKGRDTVGKKGKKIGNKRIWEGWYTGHGVR